MHIEHRVMMNNMHKASFLLRLPAPFARTHVVRAVHVRFFCVLLILAIYYEVFLSLSVHLLPCLLSVYTCLTSAFFLSFCLSSYTLFFPPCCYNNNDGSLLLPARPTRLIHPPQRRRLRPRHPRPPARPPPPPPRRPPHRAQARCGPPRRTARPVCPSTPRRCRRAAGGKQ